MLRVRDDREISRPDARLEMTKESEREPRFWWPFMARLKSCPDESCPDEIQNIYQMRVAFFCRS